MAMPVAVGHGESEETGLGQPLRISAETAHVVAAQADGEGDSPGPGVISHHVGDVVGADLSEVHAAVDHGHPAAAVHHPRRGAGPDRAVEAVLHVHHVAHDAVGVDPHEAGFHEVVGHEGGLGGGGAAGLEQLDAEVAQVLRGEGVHASRWRIVFTVSSTASIMCGRSPPICSHCTPRRAWTSA